MSTADVFSLANQFVMPMWLLMIFAPKWKVTRWLIDYKVFPLALAVLYLTYLIISINSGGMSMDFGSLEGVKGLFTVDEAILVGWVHYLAFDLVVGMWMLDQNRDLGIHPILMAPSLLATFMLGPVGLILFMLLKAIKKSKL